MPIPREVQTFTMPQVPANADAQAMAAARDVLNRFVANMLEPTAEPVDLLGLPADVVEILNQTLGEGEVAIRIAHQNGCGMTCASRKRCSPVSGASATMTSTATCCTTTCWRHRSRPWRWSLPSAVPRRCCRRSRFRPAP
jgi:hypothetical protein